MGAAQGKGTSTTTLYTEDQRQRRDSTRWTIVQGILAPLQFVVFVVSLGMVVRYLLTGEGLQAATASVIIKTMVLYAIMVTGAIWEKVVFGKYLFADAFSGKTLFPCWSSRCTRPTSQRGFQAGVHPGCRCLSRWLHMQLM
jgi:3-vinyl bacteriochlorophyllide hydratase